ncbi:sigma-70 family RNA polymerase sigma factor [Chitinophaga solisilvae]|uniref:Sigma-70 family RNA polymerase sigma factor n=1 Tax=Chitinophaga solisilvae TaxID=1233460 RepID=A0A3S1JEI5_9BACT|nr:sigma-70 family RNA polymerase sigma factor [Chitinophaga solisilvae]NSL86753.1 sigma-70 family RNA polymerase sigma factor [Chitinophaga solisilvae]
MNAISNDIELLAYLKSGCLQAFEQFYGHYREWLLITAMTFLKDEEAARELVQEFFIDFWQQSLYLRIDLSSTASMKNFLFVTIKNRCLNQMAKDDTQRRRLQRILQPGTVVLPASRLESQELAAQLEGAISLLPERQSQVFRLAYQEHKTRKEIAAAMEISEETVKKQIANALKSLRITLKKFRF